MTYRLIALDIDGTVTDSRNAVRPAVRAAIAACLDRGCRVLLTTGRILGTTRPVMRAIDPRLGAITNNGAVCHDTIDGPVLWRHLLPAVVGREIAEELAALGLAPIAFDAEATTIAVPDMADVSPRFVDRFAVNLEAVGDVAAWIAADPLMLTCLAGASAEAEALIREQTRVLGQRFAGRATVSPLWHPLYQSWILDFIAPGVSKWRGLCDYAALREIEPSAILTIGDGLNDVEMVAKAGLGVAMGQAGPELRAAADVIVSDNDHDGVAEALERFVL
jgi:hypothetical protein